MNPHEVRWTRSSFNFGPRCLQEEGRESANSFRSLTPGSDRFPDRESQCY